MSPQGDVLARLQALQDEIKAQKTTEPSRQQTVVVDAPEPSYVEGVQSRVARGAQDFVERSAGDLLGLAAFSARKAGAEKVAQFFERGREGVSEGMESVWSEQRAKVDAFQSMNGNALTRFFEQTLPGAVGGTIPMVLGGKGLGSLGRAAGLGEKGLLGATKLGVAATGATAGGVSQYYEAKALGADESTATKAFLFGAAAGVSQGYLGFGRRVSELDKYVGGAIGKTLVRMSLDGGEEWAQERFERTMNDLSARGLYDPQREVFLGLDEQDAAAAVLGLLGGGAAAVAGKVAGQPGAAPAPTTTPEGQAPGQPTPEILPDQGIPQPTPAPQAAAVVPPGTPPAAPAVTTEAEPGGATQEVGGAGVLTERVQNVGMAPEEGSVEADRLEELLDNGAEVVEGHKVRVYHRTTPEKAAEIRRTGKMRGDEDGLFFSTARSGQAESFGPEVVEFEIPVKSLELDDAFGNEAHVRVPLKRAGASINVSKWLRQQDQALAERFSPEEMNAAIAADTSLDPEVTPEEVQAEVQRMEGGRYKPGNPFAEKADRARAKADQLNRPTAHEKGMSEAFPLGAGFGRGSERSRSKKVDASVNRAVAAVEAEKLARHLEAQAAAFDRGEINAQGRIWNAEKQERSEKREGAKQRREARIQAAKDQRGDLPAWAVPAAIYADSTGNLGGGARTLVLGDHMEAVKAAVEAGQDVPPEVLADYPDLAVAATQTGSDYSENYSKEAATPYERLQAMMPEAPETEIPATEAAPEPAKQEPAPKVEKAPQEVSAFPGGLLKIPGVREFASGFKRNVASGGHLPPEAHQANIQRAASAKADIQGIHDALRDFDRTVKADYGKPPSDLSPAELARLDQVLKGGTAETVPERTLEAVSRMRRSIDQTSRRLIQSGVIEASLIPHVNRNIGFYTTRSYRVFDDPKWADEVEPAVRTKAKAFLRQEFEQRAKDARKVYATRAKLARARADLERALAAKPTTRNPDAHQAEAFLHDMHARDMVERGKEVRRSLPDTELERRIGALLFEGKAAQGPIALIKKAKLGSKDLSILMRRKGIAPEIKALYGEYKDPRINYAKSVVKMAHLIANQQFLDAVRDAGLGKFFIDPKSDDPAERGDSLPNLAELKEKIAADGSEVMAPLNGLYTTPEIAQAFRDATMIDPLPDWLRMLLKINTASKLAKTAGNPISANRNLFGNSGFALAQGHWRAWKMAPALKSIGVKWGITDTITDRMATLKSQSVAKWREYYLDALRRGVIHEDTSSGEIRQAIEDMSGQEASEWLESRALHALKLLPRAALEYYRVGDDLWKIYAWENEKARYTKAKAGKWSEEKIKTETAAIVRDTYPTMSQVPRWVRKVRQIPVFGPFLSFPSEVVRTAKNTFKLIGKELKDPDLRPIGATRLVGTGFAAFSMYGVALALRALYGITRDDDDDARELLPPWSKNSDIGWLEWGEEGFARYIDLSFMDPWGYLKKPFQAFLAGDDLGDSLSDAFLQAAEPLLSETMIASALFDIQRNKTKTGAQVYSEADSDMDILMAKTKHLAEAVTPGVVPLAEHVKMGFKGEKEDYGRQYSPWVELGAASTGARIADLDPIQSLDFMSGKYSKMRAQSSRMGSSVFKRQGTVSDEDLREAVRDADAARASAYADMRAGVRAALNLGVPEDKVFAAIRSGGSLSEDEARRLIYSDEPSTWVLSADTRKDMQTTLGRPEALRRVAVYDSMRPPVNVAER